MTEKTLSAIKTGQNFRFGYYELAPSERLFAIKAAGFDETMFWWGDEYEDTDGSRFALFDLAEKLGLGVNTCHFPSTHADWLWYGDERGEKYVRQFDSACRECGERKIKNLVLHLTRRFITPPPNGQGLINFAKLLDSAVKNDVVIALENTRFLQYNDYILSNFKDDHIGFCFDCGHANCYTPNQLPLEKYGDMLVTTHIHDNMGAVGSEPDQHHMMGEGAINYDNIFARLKHYNAVRYNLESYCNPTSKYYGVLSAEEYLSLSYKTLTEQMKKSGISR